MTSSTANVLGNETDRVALLAFKSQITQDSLNVTSSWNDSQHFCDWEGVTCNHRHQRVTVLNLDSKGLIGPISPHIGNLSFVRILVLSNNNFHGEIPHEFGQLFRLERLNLSLNSVEGKIPHEFGQLFRLEELDLSINSLEGQIPASISRCSNLIRLGSFGNNHVGKIPMELGSLSKLVGLSIGSNNLTGGIPPTLGNLTSLEFLQVSANSLDGSIPSSLCQLIKLESLGLGSNFVSGMIPPCLSNLSALQIIGISVNALSGNLPSLMLPNLRTFFIGGNKFSGPIPTSLFNTTSLVRIDFNLNQFTGEVPLNVGTLKEVELLRFDNNYLGSGKSGDLDFFTSLTNCSNLQKFGISGNQFGGMLPISFANISNRLIYMYLNSNQIYGNITNEIGNLRDLIRLDMSYNFFTGSIPLGIGNLQNLEELYLSGNRLSGKIPPSVTNLSRLFLVDLSNNTLEGSIDSILGNPILQRLDLSYNRFSGTIPTHEISLSLGLIYLTLSHNSLNGSIPLEVGLLKNLQYLDVSENKMSSEIPPTLDGCSSLEYLYFEGNFFHGPIPSIFHSLKGLQLIDLSRNNLSGEIPKELEKLIYLEGLNLSFNNLEGEVPINGVFLNVTKFSVAGNPKICGGIPKLGLHKCYNENSKKQQSHLALKVALGVLVPLVIIVLLFMVIYLRKKPEAKPPSKLPLKDLTRVSYNDLHKATDGFSSSSLIGMGTYGRVYKGILPTQEGPIAVKVLNLMERGASKSFIAKCEVLREVRHRNLLKIITVCSSVDSNGNEFKALVYEFMPNGSLESWLHPSSNEQELTRNLNLKERLNIAIDVASALEYLHNHCEIPIVHCDLKSSNVLLGDDMVGHVGDFGLTKFISESKRTSANKNESTSIAIRGTIGYIPPEYGTGAEVSTQGDVYSYGILLLEMFTGKRPTDHKFKDGINLHDFSKMALSQQLLDIIDKRLFIEETHEEFSNSTRQINKILISIIKIGVACSAELIVERMVIKTVLKEMQSIKKVLLKV